MADNNESKEVIKLDFQTNADAASQEVNGLSVSIEKTEEGYKGLKTQLREANQELQRAVQIYGATSEQAIKAAQGVAELRDTMEAAGDLAETFNPDQKFKALGAATQLAATGVQGVTAGMALFGEASEDTEKALLQVQSAMAFSDAISNLSNLGDQWALLKASISSSTLITKANTAATGAAAIVQNLFTGAVNTSSTGFKALKLAIAGTGIGLLVVGLATVVTNFDKIKEVMLKVVPGLAKVGDAIMNIVRSVTDFLGITSEAERAIDKQKSYAEKALAQNERYLKRNENTLTEAQKRELELRNQHFQRVKDGEFSQAESLAIYREAQAKDAREAQEKADKLAEEAREKREAKEKARREKQAAKEKAAHEKAVEKRKKELEEINAASDEVNEGIAKVKQKQEEDKKAKEEKDRQDFLIRAADEALQRKNAIDKEIEDDKKAAEAKKANQDLLVSQGEQLIKNVAQLAGKNKAIQKAAIIADGAIALGKAGMNTAEAVTKDLAKGAPFSAPLVALDIAVGATSAAAIIQNTTKALQAVGGGSAPSGSSATPRISGVNAQPQTGFQASSENQIATSINNANQAPQIVKAFVVGSEVTDQQTLDAKLVGENSFGGTNG